MSFSVVGTGKITSIFNADAPLPLPSIPFDDLPPVDPSNPSICTCPDFPVDGSPSNRVIWSKPEGWTAFAHVGEGGGSGGPTYNSFAQDWFNRVETTGASFGSNKQAFSDWFDTAESDGTLPNLKMAYFHVGISNLEGTLVPILGANTLSRVGFDNSGYDPVLGLSNVGASPGYLSSDRRGNDEAQNDSHISVYQAIAGSGSDYGLALTAGGAVTGATQLLVFNGNGVRRMQNSNNNSTGKFDAGLVAMSRSDGSVYTFRNAGAQSNVSRSSQTPANEAYILFNNSAYDGRIKFWSTGSAINMSLLETSLETLFEALV